MGHTRTFSNLEVKDAPEDQTLWPPDGPSHWVVIPGFIQNSEHAIYSLYCVEINRSLFFFIKDRLISLLYSEKIDTVI